MSSFIEIQFNHIKLVTSRWIYNCPYQILNVTFTLNNNLQKSLLLLQWYEFFYLMQWEQWNILFGNPAIKCKVIIRFRLRQIDQSAHSWHGLKTRMITHDQIFFVQSSYVGVKEVGNIQLWNFRIKLLIQLYRLCHLGNG